MRFTLKTAEEIKAEHGLEEGGSVQQYIDGAVISYCEPYVPYDTGALKSSPYSFSPPGEGRVVYGVDYARKQYNENKGGDGLRGARWFERMKADRLDDIVEGAASCAKGRVE